MNNCKNGLNKILGDIPFIFQISLFQDSNKLTLFPNFYKMNISLCIIFKAYLYVKLKLFVETSE
jgi:hypothetical protein